MEDQTEFVRWWGEAVTPNKGGDRKSENQSPRLATLIAEDAENLTGITKQQVSKWGQRLKEPDAPWPSGSTTIQMHGVPIRRSSGPVSGSASWLL